MSGERRLDCGTHGNKPWDLEIMCRDCGRIYKPRASERSAFDGPFIEPAGDAQTWSCVCGELLAQLVLEQVSGTQVDVVLADRCGEICAKCFKDEIKKAKRARIDVNDPSACAERRARAASHQD